MLASFFDLKLRIKDRDYSLLKQVAHYNGTAYTFDLSQVHLILTG